MWIKTETELRNGLEDNRATPRELLRHRTFVFHLHEYTSSYKSPVKVEKWVLNKDLVF